MSSTNRGAERHVQDYYRTPIPAIVDFLRALVEDVEIPDPVLILDPCAGGDAGHPMSYPTALSKYPLSMKQHVWTLDISPHWRPALTNTSATTRNTTCLSCRANVCASQLIGGVGRSSAR